MAARYVRIGQHPDYRDEIRGTLSEILASTANPGTYAAPEDVTGTFLEMGADGLWTGASVGYLTKAQADAIKAAQGVQATLKVGVPAQVDGGPVTWRGAGSGGWVVDRSIKYILSKERATGVGLKTIIIGSSSDEYCSTTFADPLTAAVFRELSDGWFSHVQSRFNIDLALHYNIGKAAEGSSAIYTLMTTNEAKIDESDICFFRCGANDLRLGNTLASMLTSLENSFSMMVSKGKFIVLIIPHITQTSYDSGHLQNYIDTANWAYAKATKFPSLVVVADTLKEFGYAPNGEALQDGTHLNDYGAYLSSNAFAEITKFSPPAVDGIESYGKIAFDSIVANAPTPPGTTTCTKNADGSISLVGTVNLQAVKATYSGISLTIGKKYRVVADFTPNVNSGGGTYSSGVVVKSTSLTREFNYAIHASSGNVNNVNGVRYRRIFPAFQAVEATHTLDLFAGASFSFATFHRVVIIQID